jgi:hypothetical protein
MSTPTKYLITKAWFHPPEADRIADNIHTFLEKLVGEYLSLKGDFERGTSDWFGKQKEKFVDQAQPRMPKLASFVEYLRSRERYYRAMQESKTEQYPNPEWEEYEKSKNK